MKKTYELSETAVEIPRSVLQEAYRKSGSPYLQELLSHQTYVFSAELLLDCNMCKIAISGRFPRLAKYDARYEFSPEMVEDVVKFLKSNGHIGDALTLFKARLDHHYSSAKERLFV